MSKSFLYFLCLGYIAFFCSAAYAAPCRDYVVDARQSSGASYEPASMAGIVVDLAITSADGPLENGCTSVPIKIEPRDGGSFRFSMGPDLLAYSVQNSNLVGARSTAQIVLNGNARNLISSGNVATVPLFAIQPGQFVRAGRYVAPLIVTVGDGPPVAYELAVDVEPSIRFVAENGAREKSLSFGDTAAGALRSSTIFYRTNAAFQLRATSQNGGTLVHEAGARFGLIAYQASYDGTPIELGTGAALLSRTYPGATVQSDVLKVDILPQTGKYAGRYRDVLTLEFIPF